MLDLTPPWNLSLSTAFKENCSIKLHSSLFSNLQLNGVGWPKCWLHCTVALAMCWWSVWHCTGVQDSLWGSNLLLLADFLVGLATVALATGWLGNCDPWPLRISGLCRACADPGPVTASYFCGSSVTPGVSPHSCAVGEVKMYLYLSL